MLSHNNSQELIKKYEPKKQHFTIKKLSVGVASVLLGVSFAAGVAHADTSAASQGANGAAADRQSQPSDQEATKQDSQVTVNSAAANQNPVISVNTSAAPVAAHQADQSTAATNQSAADQQKGSQAQVEGKQAKDAITPFTQLLANAPVNAKTVANWNDFQNALMDNSVNQINVQGNLTANNNATVNHDVTINGIDGATINFGANSIKATVAGGINLTISNINLVTTSATGAIDLSQTTKKNTVTFDNVTAHGSALYDGAGDTDVYISGVVNTDVDSSAAKASAEQQGMWVSAKETPLVSQFSTADAGMPTNAQYGAINNNQRASANIHASNLYINQGATLNVTRSVDGDGVILADGILKTSPNDAGKVTGNGHVNVGKDASLNITLKDGNLSGDQLKSSERDNQEIFNDGIRVNTMGSFTTDEGAKVSMKVGHGRGISFSEREVSTDPKSTANYTVRGDSQGWVSGQQFTNTFNLGTNASFDFTGREAFVLGPRATFQTDDGSAVTVHTYGHGSGLAMDDFSTLNIGLNADQLNAQGIQAPAGSKVQFFSDGKSNDGDWVHNNYVMLGEDGKIYVNKDSTWRVILVNRGMSTHNDNINIQSAHGHNPYVYVGNNATLDVESDAYQGDDELISVPLPNSQSVKFVFDNVRYVNLQKFDYATPYTGLGAANGNGNLIFMDGGQSGKVDPNQYGIQGTGNYVVFKWNDGTQPNAHVTAGTPVPNPGPVWDDSKNVEENIAAFTASADQTWDNINSFHMPFNKYGGGDEYNVSSVTFNGDKGTIDSNNGADFRDMRNGFYPTYSQRLVIVSQNATVRPVTPENPYGQYTKEALTENVSRDVEYKLNDGSTTDPAKMANMDQSKLNGEAPASQSTQYVGTGYVDVATGDLVKVKTNTAGQPVDENGNLVAVDDQNRPVVGELQKGTIVPKLVDGKTIPTSFVVVTDAKGNVETGSLSWIPAAGTNGQFTGFTSPTATGYTVDPTQVPDAAVLDQAAVLPAGTIIKDANGKAIANPTVKDVLNDPSYDHANALTTAPVYVVYTPQQTVVNKGIQKVTVGEDVSRDVDYKENTNNSTDFTDGLNGDSNQRNEAAGLPNMNVPAGTKTKQTIHLTGTGYMNENTGQFVKVNAQGLAVDSQGRLVTYDQQGNVVVGQLVNDQVVPLLTNGQTTPTEFVQGSLVWTVVQPADGWNAPDVKDYSHVPGTVPVLDGNTMVTMDGQQMTLDDLLTTLNSNARTQNAVATDTITDAANYPQMSQVVPSSQYIFDQFQAVDATGANLPYVVTLTVDRNNPTGGVYMYVTDSSYQTIYWSSMRDNGGKAIVVNNTTPGYYHNTLPNGQRFQINVNNYGGNYGNSVSVWGENVQLRHIFGYGAVDNSITASAWGDFKPHQVTQTIKYVDQNNANQDIINEAKVPGLTGQQFNAKGTNDAKIPGYTLTNNDAASGTVSDYQVGHTYVRTWYDPATNSTVTEHFTLKNAQGDMDVVVTVNGQQVIGHDEKTGSTTTVGAGRFYDVHIGNLTYGIQNPFVPSTDTVTLEYTQDQAKADPYYVVYTQLGSVNVVFHDDTTNTDLTGVGYNSNMKDNGTKVTYTTTDDLKTLKDEGYVHVSTDGMIPATIEGGQKITVTVHVKHGQLPIGPDTPTDQMHGVDPSQVKKDVKETVHYEGAANNPADNVQTSKWGRTLTVDAVTNKVVDNGEYTTDWKILPGQKTSYDAVKTPVENGYYADQSQVDGTAVTQNDITKVVKYQKVGNVIPVDPDGNPLGNPVPFPNDPNDPTKVLPGTKPSIDNYHPATGKVGDPVNPVAVNPGADVKVPYVKDQAKQGSVNVLFHDDTTNTDLTDYNFSTGLLDDGTTDPYTQADIQKKIDALTAAGYVSAGQDGTLPATIDGDVTVTVHVKHGVQPITPETPTTEVPKNTPKEAQPDQLTKTVTETVTYVNADGTAFTGTIPANAKQTVTFTGTAYVDKVTGALVNVKQVDGTWVIDTANTATPAIAWTPETGSFTAVDSPAETGYHADKTSVAAVNNLTPTSDDINVTVTYTKNGEDTKNKQTITASQTVKYVDEQGNELPQAPAKTQNASFNYSGDTVDATTGELIKAGSWDATSHTFTAENVPVIDGYVAVSGYTVNGDGTVVAGGFTANKADSKDERDQTFTVVYHKVGKIVPVDPGHNPIPDVPTPKYPNDPDNPTKVTPNEKVPEIPDYTPSTPTVTPGDPTKDTEVVYTPVQDQKAVVNYIDLDDGGKQIATSGPLSGKAGAMIDYSTAGEIAKLEDQGYELDYDGFPVGAIYDSDNNTTQEFKVTLRHKHTTLTPKVPGDPGKPINPKDPTGPKYPANTGENDLKKTGTQTVHYEGAGDKTPGDNTQSFDFTRTITIDNVTGEILNTSDWNVASHTFGSVDTPVVDGYHANQRTAGNQTVTPDNLNKTVTVTYSPNGKIVPVDPNGNPIPKAPTPQYPTDPENPARVTPNEPVPDVPGFTPSVPTVTPKDPGKDTPVVYTPKTPTPVEQGSVKVVFQDDTTGQSIPDVGYDSGKEDNGTKVTYTTDADLKKLEDEGYVYVSTDGTLPATIDGDVTMTVHVKHGVQPITPETPTTEVPKNTPKEAQPDQLTKTVTETVTYVNADGTAFTGTIPANAKQSVTFTGTAYVDKVTGKLVNAKQVDGTWVIDTANTATPAIAWTPETGSFTEVDSPAEAGYHVDKTSVAAVKDLTPTSKDIQVTVTYTKDATTTPTPTPTEKGSVKVVYHDDTTNTDLTGYGKDSGTVAAGTPFTYDPTTDENTLKDHGYEIVTQNPVIPTEVGNTPQIITIHVKHGSQPISPKTPGIPGTPINPQDPKGPKYPSGTDAKSLQSDVTRTIQFVDENGKQVADSVEGTAHFTASGVLDKVTGEWTTPLTWTGAQTINGIKVPAVAGYHVVKIDRDANGLTKVKDVTVTHDDASYVVTVTYAKDVTTPTPTPTPTPEDQVVKGTQTVHYVDQNGNELKPTATTGSVTFTKSGKTGQWDKDSYTYGKVVAPVIPGYVATVTTVAGATVTPDDPNQVITITYTKVGKIIPVDPGGNPIPGVPTPKYPNDPTKVTPNEPVPDIPGWTPQTPTVTPGNPTTDTPVTYVPDKPKPSENPDTPTPTPTPTPDTPTPTPTPEAPATPATPKPQTPATPAPNQPATPVSPREVTPAPVAKPAAKKLPQTGNAQEGRLATLGLAALSLVGLSAGFLTDKRRKH